MKFVHEFLSVLGHPMAIVGIVGQILFFSRFLVQWIVSERNQKSTVPEAFWYFSLGGGVLVLAYSVWRRDPVFTIAQLVGLFVYVRNVMLIRNSKSKGAA
jgi:lipid-A-disaccharide synthase-like uncharacterized protein